MPARTVSGPKGKRCWQYGHRAKYCYNPKNKAAKAAAHKKMVKQMRAMFAHGWRGHHGSS